MRITGYLSTETCFSRKGPDRRTTRSGKLFGQPPAREIQRPRVGHPPSTAAWFGTARSGNQVSDEGLDRVESGLHCPRVPGGDSLSFSLASARGLRTIAPNRTRHSVVSVRGGPANFPHPQPRGTAPGHMNGVFGQCGNGCRRKTAAGTGAGARRWRGGRSERRMGTMEPLTATFKNATVYAIDWGAD